MARREKAEAPVFNERTGASPSPLPRSRGMAGDVMAAATAPVARDRAGGLGGEAASRAAAVWRDGKSKPARLLGAAAGRPRVSLAALQSRGCKVYLDLGSNGEAEEASSIRGKWQFFSNSKSLPHLRRSCSRTRNSVAPPSTLPQLRKSCPRSFLPLALLGMMSNSRWRRGLLLSPLWLCSGTATKQHMFPSCSMDTLGVLDQSRGSAS
mmetsp:Transcript_133197/g.332548  ORF Transcript_133197/g.332548 Transcript_133197/m.332548 type:complete len:209 (+) Transcript_133197:270-896(+)